MRIPGYKTLRNSARWVRSRFVGKALILGYHRIAEDASDVYGMCVSPSHFEQQLQAICELARPVSLSALVEGLEALPKRAVALTFDDGYAECLYQAKPLLERYRVPSTFFISTGALGQEFWWDELARRLPPANEQQAVNEPQAPNLGTFYEHLRVMAPAVREQALAEIRSQPGTAPRAGVRALTATELGKLASSAWVEIGSHTVTHPVLPLFPLAGQQAEIRQSKADLEALIHQPVIGFSYPNGALNTQIQTLVRDAGYVYACTSENDVVSKNSSLFALPRFWPPNWDGVRFAAWLRRWLN